MADERNMINSLARHTLAATSGQITLKEQRTAFMVQHSELCLMQLLTAMMGDHPKYSQRPQHDAWPAHLLELSSLLSSFQWYCWGALVSAQMPRSRVRLRCKRRHCLAKDCISSSCATLVAALLDFSLAHRTPDNAQLTDYRFCKYAYASMLCQDLALCQATICRA